MKTKLLAIVLSLLMLVQPVMAVGMVGMESAEEVSDVVEVLETAEETTLTGDSNVPENAVVFDDFESYNAGDAIPASFSTVYNTTGLTDALKVTADGTMSIAEFDGSKVIKNTKTIGQYYNIGFMLNNIPAVNVGKYELTFDAYLVYDGTNAWDQLVTTNITSTANYYLTALGDYKNNNWNTYKITFDVTESDGTKTCVITYCNGTTKTIDVTDKEHLGVEAHMYFTNKGVGTSQTYYLDNVALTYKAPYVPTNVPAGAILYEDFGGVEATAYGSDVAYSKNFSYAAEGYSSVTMNTYSTMTSKYMDFNGDMVLVEKPTKDYRIGMGFTGAALPDGEYVYTVNLYPVTVVPKSFTMRFQGGTQTDINLSNIGATLVAGDWNTLKYPFTIYTEDGTRKIKICNTSATTFTGTLSVQNFGTQSAYTHEFYFDDISLVKVIPATVTYVDESGATLGTISTTVGETFTVGNGISVAYTPVYTINGEKVNAGDVVTVTGDMTVNVSKYIPENMPENAVLFEDFELVDDGVKTSDAPGFTINDGGLSTYFSNGDVGAGTITTVDGNKVMLVSASLGKWNNIGIRFNNLPITEVGTYTLTFKANRLQSELFPEVDPQWQGYHMNFGSGNYNNFTSYNDEEWITYTETFEVYDNAGVKSIKWIRADGSSGNLTYSESGLTDHFYMVAMGAGEAGTADGKISTGTTMSWYLDDVCLTYDEPAVFNASFVDGNGDSFAFTDTGANDVYTLPTAAQLGVDYTPCYAYNGVTYYPGQTVAYSEDTDAEFIVSKTDVILIANGSANPAFATGEAANAVIKGTVKNGAYECSYSSWGANLIADTLTLGTYGTYTFDYNVTVSDDVSFGVHTMLYGSTSGGDAVTSIQPTVVKLGTTHISHSVTIYEKDGAPYFKNREGKEYPLDTLGYFPSVRAVAMGTSASGKFLLDNFTITFTPYAPQLVNKASYRVKDENGKTGPAGIRFASYVTDVQYDACTEYGFVVTRKTLLGGDYTKLNLKGVTVTANGVTASANADGVLVVAAAAYDGKVTRTYTHDGATFGTEYMGIEETFFTGILTGIPSGMEAEVFVGRPYIKIDGNIYYGDCIERCYNDFFAAQNS